MVSGEQHQARQGREGQGQKWRALAPWGVAWEAAWLAQWQGAVVSNSTWYIKGDWASFGEQGGLELDGPMVMVPSKAFISSSWQHQPPSHATT